MDKNMSFVSNNNTAGENALIVDGHIDYSAIRGFNIAIVRIYN